MFRELVATIAVALLVSLTGCDSGTSPTPTTAGSKSVESEAPWQAAKDQALAMQLEIAHLFPEEKVEKINHKTTGTLLGCSDEQIDWNGSTTVILKHGVDREALVKEIESHYEGSKFKIRTGVDNLGHYEIQLRSTETVENYIIAPDVDADAIRIEFSVLYSA